MAPLTLLLALAPSTVVTAPPPSMPAWQPFVTEAAYRFGLPRGWIERVILIESGGVAATADGPIRSPKGAIGLMQLMPATWNAMRSRLRLGIDPDDPRDNILAGACYLRLMYDRFGYPALFAAYNAGPSRYAAWVAGGSDLPAETWRYVARLGVYLPGRRTLSLPRLTVRSIDASSRKPPLPLRSGMELFAIPNRSH